MVRVFISSVQKEFAGERKALVKEKRGFPLDYSDDNLLNILVHLDLATAEGRLTNAALPAYLAGYIERLEVSASIL